MSAGDQRITAIEGLETPYDKPAGAAVVKEIDHISAGYQALIEAAPPSAIVYAVVEVI